MVVSGVGLELIYQALFGFLCISLFFNNEYTLLLQSEEECSLQVQCDQEEFLVLVPGSISTKKKHELVLFSKALKPFLLGLSFLTRNWTQAFGSESPSPNHWSAREFPKTKLLDDICFIGHLFSKEMVLFVMELCWEVSDMNSYISVSSWFLE